MSEELSFKDEAAAEYDQRFAGPSRTRSLWLRHSQRFRQNGGTLTEIVRRAAVHEDPV